MGDDGPDEGMPTADAIDGSWRPRVADDVAAIEVEGETVLIEGRRLTVQHLDRVATVAWRFFDGTATLHELAVDLSVAFDTDLDVVEADLLELARQLGRQGVLAGIEPDPLPDPLSFAAPSGLPVGAVLPNFHGTRLDGSRVDLAGLLGRALVVVNWSPACGYCDRAAGELAALDEELRAAGAALVLLAAGSADDNRALLERHGVALPLVLRPDDLGDDEPFPGLGTPVAYRLDADGTVAAPLAVGATPVVALGRGAVGHGEPR